MLVLKGPRFNVSSVSEQQLDHLPLTKESGLVQGSVATRVTAVHSDSRTLTERGREGEREGGGEEERENLMHNFCILNELVDKKSER